MLSSSLRIRTTTRWFALALVAGGVAGFAKAATDPAPAVAAADHALFNYDQGAPLQLREVGQEQRGDAIVRDVTFIGLKQPVKSYVVAPVAVTRQNLAGVLYVHWLGDPATTNRTEFLNEAVALASEGVVSVLVDAMWAQPNWYDERVPEADYDRTIRQVIELRRAMDLLLSQPGVDPHRIAYVGHDFGAMYGVLFGAVDQRASSYVFMSGTPHFIDWFLFSKQPKDLNAYAAQIAPLDPVRFVSQLSPAPIFFQFAAQDKFVSATAAAEFFAAAAPEKHLATYNAGHDLQKPAVTSDRVAWLLKRLKP
jgi:dienelactone hydrolase